MTDTIQNKISLVLDKSYNVKVKFNSIYDQDIYWESKKINLFRGYGKKLWYNNKYELTVIRNKKDINKPFKHDNIERYYSFPVLKSTIQKAVRRNMVKESLLLSLQSIIQNVNGFVRRLSIIMIEDAIINEDLPFIIWCMIAITKGYKLTFKDIYQLLCIVYKISAVKYKDQFQCTDYKYIIMGL